jgi:hypothetical protein
MKRTRISVIKTKTRLRFSLQVSILVAAGIIPALNVQTAQALTHFPVTEAVFRPGSHSFYINGTADPVSFGRGDDLPFSGDFDGNGLDEVGVFRPGNHTFYVRGMSATGQSYGATGDKPVVADYNGDGTADLGVFRPSNHTFYIIRNGVTVTIPFGRSTDQPFAGDYDGDGQAEVGVFRPENATFYIKDVNEVGTAFGHTGDKPVAGDFNGDHKNDIALFRPATATFYVMGIYEGFNGIPYGRSTDAPLTYAGPINAVNQFSVVSANPRDGTPQLPVAALGTNVVRAYATIGDTMFAGGGFPQINGVSRSNIAAFSLSSSALTAFNPSLDGQVNALLPSDDGELYIAGAFATVNGVARPGLAKVTPSGALDTSFNANLTNGSTAYDLALTRGRLIVSGNFPAGLLGLNPNTGANTGYISLGFAGSVASNAGSTRVERFAVSPDGSRLVGLGNFSSINGTGRRQAFMVQLGTSNASLSGWNSTYLNQGCQTNVPVYLTDVDFSPDGSHFAVSSSGGGFSQANPSNRFKLCDSVSWWGLGESSLAVPVWINYAGDSMYSVTVTAAAVYVGGHQRWLNNPFFSGNVPGGCANGVCPVEAWGLGAVNPSTGQAYAWNPFREARGHGVEVFYKTASGIWFGGDAVGAGQTGCSSPSAGGSCSGKPLEQHAGMGFFPL